MMLKTDSKNIFPLCHYQYMYTLLCFYMRNYFQKYIFIIEVIVLGVKSPTFTTVLSIFTHSNSLLHLTVVRPYYG